MSTSAMNQESLSPASDGKTKSRPARRRQQQRQRRRRRQLRDSTNRKRLRCESLKPNNDGWDEDDYRGNGPPPPLVGGQDSDDEIDDDNDDDYNDGDYNDEDYNNDDEELFNNNQISDIENHVSGNVSLLLVVLYLSSHFCFSLRI
jgi:hypothetical protein